MSRIIISIILICSYSTSYALPQLGNEARTVLPLQKEQAIGTMILQQLRANKVISDDPIANEYIRHIGKRLAMVAPLHEFAPHFYVADDPAINAFTTLGANVVIFTGLICSTNSESELAAVIAHELAHISQQHILRLMATNKKLMPLTITGLIAATLIGIPQLMLPTLAGHEQAMLNFSRHHEQEADRIGMKILQAASFDPQGMPDIFYNMSKKDRFNNQQFEYLLTHPMYNSRISDAKNRATQFKYKQFVNSLWYELVKIRFNILTNNQHSDHEKNYYHPDSSIQQYGMAFSALTKNKLATALKYIKPLANKFPNNLIIQLTAAKIESRNNQASKAKMRLKKLIAIYPNSYALLLNYAEVLLQLKQADAAQRVILHHQKLYPNTPLSYKLLIKAEALLNNKANQHQANAELLVLNGDLTTAITQLELALRYIDDNASNSNFNSASLKVKARLEQIKQQMRLQMSL